MIYIYYSSPVPKPRLINSLFLTFFIHLNMYFRLSLSCQQNSVTWVYFITLNQRLNKSRILCWHFLLCFLSLFMSCSHHDFTNSQTRISNFHDCLRQIIFFFHKHTRFKLAKELVNVRNLESFMSTWDSKFKENVNTEFHISKLWFSIMKCLT